MPSATIEAIRPVDDAAGSLGASDGKRLDIQGLRAVAVLLVVLDHLWGWPNGGFVGVDVFFVLSGFLITGILLREGEKTGRLSIANFYRRRARRILPAALLALTVTVCASYLIMLKARFDATLTDAIWSLFFLVNWHFAAVGTDYFQSALPPSPFQHYWSLAVEEQFYLAWPLMLAIVLLIARLARSGGREFNPGAVVGVVAAVICGVSFAWAMYQSAAEPTVAYFSTFTRAWELALGALLAAIAPRLTELPTAVRNMLAGLGIAGIIFGAFVIDSTTQFPAPSGAIVVIATALVIASGIGRDDVAASWPLRLPPMVYIGTISYSVYLWHWPTIVLLEAEHREKDTTFYVLAIGITLVVSMLSYHLVEAPVLNSDFLRPDSHGSWRRGGGFGPSRDGQIILLVALAIVTSVMVVVALSPRGYDGKVEESELATLQPRLSDQADSDPLEAEIIKALESTQYPPLTPSLDDPTSGMASEMEAGTDCLNPPNPTDVSACTYGPANATKTAVVIGDSVALSWMPAIRTALPDWRVHAVTFSNCPYADVDVDLVDPGEEQNCASSRPLVLEQIRELKPDLVIGSQAEDAITRLASGATDKAAIDELAAGVRKTAEAVTADGAQFVVLTANPPGPSVSDCATRGSSPEDCVTKRDPTREALEAAEQAGTDGGVGHFVDSTPWFCYNDRCPIFVANRLVRWDGVHLTEPYAKFIAPRVEDALTKAMHARAGA